MPTISYGISLSAGGVDVRQTITRTVENLNVYEVSLPVGKAGTLTARTDNDTGEATLGSGHGITDGMIVDVYWSGGVRYGMTVGTVASLVVPLDGGAGDNLPSTSTALVVTEQEVINTSLDGDTLAIIGVSLEVATGSTGKGHVDFQDSGDSSIEEIDLVGNAPAIYDIEGGATNVFTGNPITHCQASNGSSTVAATLKIIAGSDATP